MNYVLIKPPWVDMIRRQHWFPVECIAYPVDEYCPEFLIGAYFIPEFRLLEHPKFSTIYLGAYESIIFARQQYEMDNTFLIGEGAIIHQVPKV